MKLLLTILAVVLVAASFYADYKWRQWLAARKRDRQ
jgi:general stress protein CsbA